MYYITTAIDYTNGKPHIGHAYEKVLADVLARWHRMMGEEVYFLTGVDQHGQKVQKSAEKEGIEPQEYTDNVTRKFLALWERLNISYDGWASTTDPRHKTCVQKILIDLHDKGLLYKKSYKGIYSVRQEQFLTDKERGEDGQFGPEWGEVIEIEEENWYFKLTEQAQWLKNFITSSDTFVQPADKKVQLLNAVDQAFEWDLCISRPKNRLSWGIELPFDPEFVTYVWFDALINYISFAGYLAEEGSGLPNFAKLWPAGCEIIGKDILVPAHGIYWPAMLHAIGFPDEAMPSLLVHGWWNINNEKMSKSIGNVVDPNDLVNAFGAEAVRYYLVRDITTGKDANFDADRLKMIYNTELANDLGNLCNRSLNMCLRYCEGTLPAAAGDDEASAALRESLAAAERKFIDLMNGNDVSEALAALNAHVGACNGYIEQKQPWALAKDPEKSEELARVLRHLLESCAHIGYLLACVLPDASARILDQLQATELFAALTPATLQWDILPAGHTIQAPSPIFPRILSEEEKAKLAAKAKK
ncbi:methionine--tRNA ligase [Akkermansia glycaniphila]|uniref:Methionine--tRNA ligase n=1 Tax=Akkermansia glycaniphila TaxID=1679444 RepID=A0A1C7PBU6_9BACT|nr:methionine--tRNA ligase [Akkermansia glycaniphila]OCA02995.1 methionyl-tRNA synthetase [Akkermansia glycaniphila]SEH95197.1 metg: methionine--trna ligase [Akkermansia glycaniphila]